MSNLEKLRERAIGYSLKTLKKKIKGKEPFGSGFEGDVYHLDDGLVVKFRKWRGAGDNQFGDNLAEFQRQAVHDTVNTLANGRIKWTFIDDRPGYGLGVTKERNLTSKLIDILACFVDGKQSASIMPYVHGGILDCDVEIKGMFDAYKRYGVAGDLKGTNVLYQRLSDFWIESVDYLLLETWGVLHPDIFKSIEKIEPKNKTDVLTHLARAYLYGATVVYPTPHEEMAGMGFMVYRPINWHDVALVSKANEHNEITYTNLEECLGTARKKLSEEEVNQMSRCGLSSYEWGVMGIPALMEARKLFGPQFIPIPFDWDGGSNLDIYGINPTLYNEFKQAVDRVRPEVQPTIDLAKKLMGEK